MILSQGRDVWYEAGSVWYLHRDGFTPGESPKPLLINLTPPLEIIHHT